MTSSTETANLWRFDLRQGNSDKPQNGACLLDAVSWFEYGTLGDHPPCVCDVIACYGRSINDRLPDAERQRLKAYIPRLVGTVDKGARRLRAKALARHTVCTVLPMMYDAIREPAIAAMLRALSADAPMHELHAAALKARNATVDVAANAVTALNTAYAAAAHAAYAAYATYGANATYAATYGANAAFAATYAAANAVNTANVVEHAAIAAACKSFYDAMITGLDLMLAIGKQADPISVDRFSAAVEAFALAREAV
jgi:hypothetical protein